MNIENFMPQASGAAPLLRPWSAVVLYASPKASPQVLTCALDFRHRGWVILLPPSQLPPPCPVRVASLRQESEELCRSERIITWLLAQYAEHYLLPDACHEDELRAKLAATRARLCVLAATLGAVASPVA